MSSTEGEMHISKTGRPVIFAVTVLYNQNSLYNTYVLQVTTAFFSYELLF